MASSPLPAASNAAVHDAATTAGVAVDLTPTLGTQPLEGLDVARLVDRLQFGPRRHAGHHRDERVAGSRLADAGDDSVESLRALRVPGPVDMLGTALVRLEQHAH